MPDKGLLRTLSVRQNLLFILLVFIILIAFLVLNTSRFSKEQSLMLNYLVFNFIFKEECSRMSYKVEV